MSVNLQVQLCGKTLKNPIIAASGTFGFGKEYHQFYDVGMLGGISTKGLTYEPRQGNASPRIAETPSGMLNSVGLQNPGVLRFITDEMPFLQTLGTCVIANIAGNLESDYCRLAEALEQSSVDMLELNISCPNVKHGGMAFGVLPESVKSITSAVRKHTTKPLIVKLTPNVSDIADNARAAEDGGADAVSLINTVGGMAVDFRTRRPILRNNIGGLSGPCVKPIALKMVRSVYKAVKIPIIGMGGIMTAEDVFEFMICGARAVMMGSANIIDPCAAQIAVNNLTKLAEECRLKDINELVGTLQEY